MIILSENPYLQELRRQRETLTNEINIMIEDYNNVNDLFVMAKLKPLIEKKEKRLLEIKKEVEEWESQMPV